MQGEQDWLGTCKQSLLRICRERLQPTDSVGLLVFDHRILRNVPLSPLSTDRLVHIENELATVRADGGTDLWTPMAMAVNTLAGRQRQKWIIALTDGYSGHSTPQSVENARERLRRADAENVNVLAITVNLNARSRDQIQQVCINGRTGNNTIIRADGQLAELEAAWEEAGKTVSEKIEEQGESLTDTDCHSLLHEYMHLDDHARCGTPWSMLQQSYWVRYMQRRCQIFRSSDKVNYNEDYPTFGSSTMVPQPRP